MNICDYGCGRQAIKTFKNGLHCCSMRTAGCPENIKSRSKNRSKTMNKVGNDGLTTFQRTSIKNAKARGKDGYAKSTEKMKTTKRSDIDENGFDCYQRTARKTAATRLNDIDDEGNNSYIRGGKKTSIILRKRFPNIQSFSGAKEYYYRVLSVTSFYWNNYSNLIEDSDLRGNDYHLDHIFSIKQGFLNRIDPEIIGHITNLRIIKSCDNISKSDTCHKTIIELLTDYFSFQLPEKKSLMI